MAPAAGVFLIVVTTDRLRPMTENRSSRPLAVAEPARYTMYYRCSRWNLWSPRTARKLQPIICTLVIRGVLISSDPSLPSQYSY